MMNNFLNGMFGKVGSGMCRLSMNGGIAVKTNGGYKTYNIKTGKLTNCSNFVFDIGEEFFFIIPTNKVEKGDIILVNGKPRCVIEADKTKITVINYEDSTIETVLPERHVFMGNTYFYGKIVSMFGSDIIKGKKGTNNIFKYMMLSQMMKGDNGSTGMMNGNGGMSSILPLMMMGGNMGDMFDGMFDFDMSSNDDDDTEVDEEEEVINSTTDGSLGDNVIIASVVNKYKNYFGKSRVVVIQSQLGDPICAYSGDEVYWQVCQDLPKTTKLMIDGKALYIHRANFQIIDKSLLN